MPDDETENPPACAVCGAAPFYLWSSDPACAIRLGYVCRACAESAELARIARGPVTLFPLRPLNPS